jgi:hypothetical protein
MLHSDMVRDQDRCASIDNGCRCQLLLHDDGQHAAMVKFDLSPERGRRRQKVSGYRTWDAPWTKPEPGQAPLPWAPTFPRLET